MIGYISGVVLSLEPPTAIIVTGGVGYEVDLPSHVLAEFKVGSEVELAVRTLVRADSFALYGFADRLERSLFDSLLKVQGVGPSVALGLIGSLGVQGCYTAVANEDVAALRSAPGVGDKTARRIVVDLSTVARRSGVPIRAMAVRSEVREGLLALGFRPREFEPILDQVPDTMGAEDGLRWILKELRS